MGDHEGLEGAQAGHERDRGRGHDGGGGSRGRLEDQARTPFASHAANMLPLAVNPGQYTVANTDCAKDGAGRSTSGEPADVCRATRSTARGRHHVRAILVPVGSAFIPGAAPDARKCATTDAACTAGQSAPRVSNAILAFLGLR